MLEHISVLAAASTKGGASYTIHWYDPIHDEVKEGDLIPSITFTLTPAEQLRSANESPEANQGTERDETRQRVQANEDGTTE